MTAVSAGTDPAELLGASGALLVGLALIRPVVHAYVAWFNRHLLPPATADARALRSARVSLPAASPTVGNVAEPSSPDAGSATAGEQQ